MVKQKLRNVFYQDELDVCLQQERLRIGAKTKSAVLRRILKERYGLCAVDDCPAIAISEDLCQNHAKRKGDKK